jgi:tripartite-type tricarboxylate transporter receptor subunit TctC
VEKLRPKGVRFKSAEFQWLGAFDAIVQVMTLWHTAPAKTLADLKTARATEVVVGSFNKTHLTYQWAMLLKSTIGATYKVITGYRGGGPLNVAMEKGEISGWTASWANLTATKAHWLRDRKVNLFVQFSLDRQPDMPDVPTLLELAPPDKKDVVEFITAGTPIARAMTVGPRVPADRVAALRKAFADTMKDPAFLADAKKRKLGIHPRSAEETTALVKKIVSASPDLVARVKTAIGSSD